MSEPQVQRKKILVIDDEAEICDLMKGWLSYLDYEVVTATDGDDGLWKAKTQKPDLIITDVLMPGRTGYQMAEQLRGLPDSVRHTPIVMMSARQSMRDAGGLVNAFVDKPFEPRAMLDIIHKLLKHGPYAGH